MPDFLKELLEKQYGNEITQKIEKGYRNKKKGNFSC